MSTLAELARRLQALAGRTRSRRGRRLPPLLLMTDPARLPDPLAAAAALPAGAGVILRHYDDPDRAALARALAALCRRRRLRLLIAGDAQLAAAVAAGGLHLPEWLVPQRGRWAPLVRPGWLVTAAAHSPRAVARASAAGVDAMLLSPVFATASHPDAPALGPLRFASLVRSSAVPVYALGGISEATAGRLTGSGAAGLAAIGALTAPQSRAGPAAVSASPRRGNTTRSSSV